MARGCSLSKTEVSTGLSKRNKKSQTGINGLSNITKSSVDAFHQILFPQKVSEEKGAWTTIVTIQPQLVAFGNTGRWLLVN